ncbi:hypothetical protein D9V84_06025 [Bacteroidetes/Chlorobi group bacterium Naka2016]|jgi:methylmalonyl-CoA mutase|nr:MAG: hypothetical protein D9V84_06025 [Bacteroidetes/Chlorobi group bacterium Naka2016]
MDFFAEFEAPNFNQWKEEAEKALKGKPLEKLYTILYEDINVKPIYTNEDRPDVFTNEFPGLPYFLRSSKIESNRIQPWAIIQRIETPYPLEANSIINNELEKGANGFSIKHFNYDFEKPKGVVLDTILDFEELFKNVDLKTTQIHFETNYPFELLTLFVAFLEKHGIDKKDISGSICNPTLFDFLQKGKLVDFDFYLNSYFLRTVKYAKTHLPNFKTLVIDGTIFFESGANAVQEIAFTLNLAVEYFKGLIKYDFTLEELLGHTLFKFSIGSDIFLNIAKIRAFRLLWAKIIESFEVEIKNLEIPIYAVTNKRNKSRLDSYVNMLRNTAEVLNAILSSANSIEVTPYDYFSSPTSEFSFRNARNTQLVLKEEHFLSEVIDPLGGSCYLENLTKELSLRALELFKEIEKSGGFFENVKNSSIQSQINEMKNKRMNKLARREEILVGTNRFPNPDDKFKEDISEKIDYKVVLEKSNVKSRESSSQSTTKPEEKMFLHQIINPEIFSNHLYSVEPLYVFREAEVFEEIRAKSYQYEQKFGAPPKVLLIPFGNVSEYRDRVDFANDFLRVGGFDVLVPNGLNTVEEAFQKFYETQPQIVVFCSSNEKYPDFVPQLSALIKKSKPLTINVLAGLLSETEVEFFKSVGVDEFIHLKSDIVQMLNRFYKLLIGI